MAATTAVGAASLFFSGTHAARGAVFGLMAGGLAVHFGVAFVLSGDLAVPIGIHFGVNVAGMLAGSAPQPATLVHVTSSATVTESLVLPDVAVAARLLGAAVSIGLRVWWYRRKHGRIRVSPKVVAPLRRETYDREEPTD